MAAFFPPRSRRRRSSASTRCTPPTAARSSARSSATPTSPARRRTDGLLSAHVPVWRYEFADEHAPPLTSGTTLFPLGAPHASELPHLFDLGGRPPRPDRGTAPAGRHHDRLLGPLIPHRRPQRPVVPALVPADGAVPGAGPRRPHPHGTGPPRPHDLERARMITARSGSADQAGGPWLDSVGDLAWSAGRRPNQLVQPLVKFGEQGGELAYGRRRLARPMPLPASEVRPSRVAAAPMPGMWRRGGRPVEAALHGPGAPCSCGRGVRPIVTTESRGRSKSEAPRGSEPCSTGSNDSGSAGNDVSNSTTPSSRWPAASSAGDASRRPDRDRVAHSQERV